MSLGRSSRRSFCIKLCLSCFSRILWLMIQSVLTVEEESCQNKCYAASMILLPTLIKKGISEELLLLSRPFQMLRVNMWGLSLYCCVSHRCCTAEQRLMTTLTITTSAAMSVLRALVMVSTRNTGEYPIFRVARWFSKLNWVGSGIGKNVV